MTLEQLLHEAEEYFANDKEEIKRHNKFASDDSLSDYHYNCIRHIKITDEAVMNFIQYLLAEYFDYDYEIPELKERE